jgi:hypothetical protein
MVILNSLSGLQLTLRKRVPLGGQKFAERTERTCKFSLRAPGVSTENHPNRLWYPKKSVEKRSASEPVVPCS